jgi:hypothetical protein
VTGLKALNVNIGFVTGFAELKKAESDRLLDFFVYHIHSADDHAVRWKWAVGSVAMWDNRYDSPRIGPGICKMRNSELNELTWCSFQMHTSSGDSRDLYRPSKGHPNDCVWREA